MIWHIAKREILDNLTRFRFALTVILIMSLMVMNAVIFVSSKYQRRIAQYSQDTNAATESLKERSASLGELGVSGPGDLYKSQVHWRLSPRVQMQNCRSGSPRMLLPVATGLPPIFTTRIQTIGGSNIHRMSFRKMMPCQILRNWIGRSSSEW